MIMYKYIVLGDKILGSFKSPAKALELAKATKAKVLMQVENDYDFGNNQKFYTIKNKIYIPIIIIEVN